MGIKTFQGDTTDLATLEAAIITWQGLNPQVTVTGFQQSLEGTVLVISIIYQGEANP